MNWDRIEGNWKQFKGKVKEQWGKLTDDDIDVIAGKRDQLVGKIQEQYGITKDEAEKQVDRSATSFRDEDLRTLPITGGDDENVENIAGAVRCRGLCLAGGATRRRPDSKDARDQAIKAADAQYKTDKAACDGADRQRQGHLPGRGQGQGEGRQGRSRGDATKARRRRARTARMARADANYEVAKEKCDDLAGNAKDVCVKEAKAAHVKAKADAKVDRVAADSSNTAVQKTAEARKDAAEDKRDADYKVAVEKCDALAGDAKDACVRDAKARFGKT